MTTILVTGSEGQLGRELAALAHEYSGYEFIFTDLAQLDITNQEAVNDFVSKVSPSWFINCAAYTAVDKAEDDPAAAFSVNAGGPANIASALKGTGCHFIHISTDYVFDGTGNRPYNESDSPCPASIYGKSKLEGEYNALIHPRTLIIRTAWLYSLFGSNFVKTIASMLAAGKEPQVVFDQVGSPTGASGLAQAIMSIVSGVIRNRHPFVPGVYNYSDEGVCSWFDVAVTIASAAGNPATVKPCLSSQFVQKAPRPAYSVMDKQKIKETYNIKVPYWRDNLLLCLKQLI